MNPSTVFVNEVNDTLETSCGVSSRKLTGSFLITFENCSISIRNKTFSNRIIGIVNQPLFAPSAHLKVTKEALEERINIHSLHLQNKLNLKQLHHLNLKADSHKWSLIGGFSISSTVILTLIFYICLKPKNRQTVKIPNHLPPNSTHGAQTAVQQQRNPLSSLDTTSHQPFATTFAYRDVDPEAQHSEGSSYRVPSDNTC